MKTTLFVIFSMISFGGFSINHADPATPLKVSETRENVYQLVYGAKTEKAVVRIINESGDVIFSEVLKNVEGFSRPYNFKFLPKGEYTIEVKDGDRILRDTIVHKAEKPEPQESMVVRVKQMKNEAGRYVLTVVNPANDKALIRIMDERMNVLYESTLAAENHAIVQLYKVKHEPMSLVFEVISGNQTRVITH